MHIAFLLIVLLLPMSIALGMSLGQSFNEVTTFWNTVFSVLWLVILIYVAWKVLDNQRKLDEKLTKILERLEKIIQHLGADREQRDADPRGNST